MPDNKIRIVFYKLIKGFTFLIILTQLFFIQNSMAQTIDSSNPYQLQLIKTIDQYFYDKKKNSQNTMEDLKQLIPELIMDLVYCTSINFTGEILYPSLGTSYLRQPAAAALQKIQLELKEEGLALKIWDAYRPYQVTRKMWQVVPDARYAADPATGSGHNRGIAVDLTLVDRTSGKELDMGTDFDNFTEKAHHDCTSLPNQVLLNRKKLKSLMESNGFKALETEWWHYSWQKGEFELMDLSFEQLKEIVEASTSTNLKNKRQ